MQIVEDAPGKLVLEKTLTASDIWRQWRRPLMMPLLFLTGSSIALLTDSLRSWLVWIIFVVAFIVVALIFSLILSTKKKIIVNIDLQSRIATRLEKLIYGKVTKNQLALDQVDRILINSAEGQHIYRTTLWLDTQNSPRLEVMEVSSLNASQVESLDILAMKIGEFLRKPVVSKKTDYKGNTISEEIKSS